MAESLRTFTQEEMKEILDPSLWPIVNRWLLRGDGIAVYVSQAMDSGRYGEHQFVSYGSAVCQLEVSEAQLPKRLPDGIGKMINWAYQLDGVYRGAILEGKAVREFKTEILGVRVPPDPWEKIHLWACDLCTKVAVWRHPKGGLRCRKCPRPHE